MFQTVLHRLGLRSVQLELASMASVALCAALWIRAKTVDQDERGNAERRAIFVGLWPPTLWLVGESLRRVENGPRRPFPGRWIRSLPRERRTAGSGPRRGR
jgi:hypothetical protein